LGIDTPAADKLGDARMKKSAPLVHGVWDCVNAIFVRHFVLFTFQRGRSFLVARDLDAAGVKLAKIFE